MVSCVFYRSLFFILFIIIFCIYACVTYGHLKAKEIAEDKKGDNSFESLLKRLSTPNSNHLINYILLELNYSDHLVFTENMRLNQRLDDINALYVKYGFYREDRKVNLDNYYKFQNEFVSFGNYSSFLNAFTKQKNEYTQESWVGSLGINNGFALKENRLPLLSLFEIQMGHSYSLDINRIDFQQISAYPEFQKIFEKYDEKYSFGNTFSSSIGLKSNNFILKFAYEDKLVYPNFYFFPWMGAFLIDNTFQKVPDIFEEELITEFGDYYPYLLFVYKTLYSLVLNNLREKHSFYPFSSESSLRYQGALIGVSVLFRN